MGNDRTSVAPQNGPSRRTRASYRRRSQYGSRFGIFLFLLPSLAIYSILIVYPGIISFYYSLLEWDGGPFSRAKFIGLGNFERMWSDPYLPVALGNAFRLVLVSWGLQLPLALLLAVAIMRLRRGRSLYRFLFMLPYIVPVATLALVWGFVFSGQSYGQLNSLLRFLGLGGLVQSWLSADGVVQWVTVFPQAFIYVGFFMIIFTAALVGIPNELYEAAQVDGAGAWRQFVHITLPSIRTIYTLSLIVSLQLALAAFLFPLLLTNGGPLHRSESPVSYSLYLLTFQQEWGYASAVNVLMFVIGVITVTLVWLVTRERSRTRRLWQGRR